jgi:hypothetical protein
MSEGVYFNMALHDDSYCLQEMIDTSAQAGHAMGTFVFTELQMR